VAWDNLMEDLATLEISRAQIWQWLRHNVKLDDGTAITRDLIRKVFDEELRKISEEVRQAYQKAPEAVVEREIALFRKAKEDAERIFLEKEFRPFYAKSSELWQPSR
jgi:malate synthase